MQTGNFKPQPCIITVLKCPKHASNLRATGQVFSFLPPLLDGQGQERGCHFLWARYLRLKRMLSHNSSVMKESRQPIAFAYFASSIPSQLENNFSPCCAINSVFCFDF
ncbi:hypothetical protein CEXT_144561 [Caerostris extrusa]|uniref:Uncharacterized protein n=1 Tax=Caerostris extrusa TaxID=172846 RepID=A0AAV4Y6K4_CAEEX|nr:hypothetical protein CEXT_144561 [Caerostris extrusa]